MSKVDLVRFLPTTDSEAIAKRANYQFEKRLETQLKGIKRQERFSRIIIQKSNTVLKQHIMLKRQKSASNSDASASQQYYQGCLRMSENSSGEWSAYLNRRAFKDDSLYYKEISQSPTGYEKRQVTKQSYVHRSPSRASSIDSYNNNNNSNVTQHYPTAIPKRITQSFEVVEPDRLVRMQSASHLDLTTRYNKWCDSMDKMKNTSDNNIGTEQQRPEVRYPDLRRRRSNTISNPEDIRLEDIGSNEETSENHSEEDLINQRRELSIPRRPDTAKPLLRRQQRLCRVSSVPGSIASLASATSAPKKEPRFYMSKDLMKTVEKKNDQEIACVEIIKKNSRKKSVERSSVDTLLPLMMNNSLKCDMNNNNGISNSADCEEYLPSPMSRNKKKALKASQSWDNKNCYGNDVVGVVENVLPKITKKKLRMTKSVQ